MARLPTLALALPLELAQGLQLLELVRSLWGLLMSLSVFVPPHSAHCYHR